MTLIEPTAKPTKQNRSAEELAMRDAVEAWGRLRWPGARVVHELVTGQRRVDVAFVGRDYITGVEIKSSKDTLDRLEKQIDTFERHLPEVWLAISPKWIDQARGAAHRLIVVEPPKIVDTWGDWYKPNRAMTAPMLHLLWRGELASIASRKRLDHGKRSTMSYLIPLLARKLTGDEIVEEVCRELRARNAFWKSDEPIPVL